MTEKVPDKDVDNKFNNRQNHNINRKYYLVSLRID